MCNQLASRSRLELLANVNEQLNSQVADFTGKFTKVFEVLQMSKKSTLNLVVPSYYKLINFCSASPEDTAPIKLLKLKAAALIDKKFFKSIKAFHWVATFLDPAFKSLIFVPEKSNDQRKFKDDIICDIDKWIKEFIPGRLPSPEYQSPPAKKSRVSDLFADFEDPQPGTSSASPLKDFDAELKAYRCSNIRSPDGNPLTFWKGQAGTFPQLAKVARKVFVAQGHSAQSERDFSAAGNIITAKRSLLGPDRVGDIELINSAIDAGIFTF